MSKRKVGIYWRWTWGLITPLVLIIIFIYFCATITRLTYGNASYPDSALCKHLFPRWKCKFNKFLIADAGWAILVVALVQLIMWIFYTTSVNSSYGFPQVWGNSIFFLNNLTVIMCCFWFTNYTRNENNISRISSGIFRSLSKSLEMLLYKT